MDFGFFHWTSNNSPSASPVPSSISHSINSSAALLAGNGFIPTPNAASLHFLQPRFPYGSFSTASPHVHRFLAGFLSGSSPRLDPPPPPCCISDAATADRWLGLWTATESVAVSVEVLRHKDQVSAVSVDERQYLAMLGFGCLCVTQLFIVV